MQRIPWTRVNQLGYDTRSLRSALFMAATDLLSLPRRRTAEPFTWGRSCVISSVAGLGDLFIQLPLIAGLVTACQERDIPVRVALRPSHADIGRQCGWDVLPFDNALTELFKAPHQVRLGKLARRVSQARSDSPDLWIDLSGNAMNALLIKLTGARRIASRITRGGANLVSHALPHVPQENEYEHVTRLAGYFGCKLERSVFTRLEVGESAAPGGVVLGLTTACQWRNWPLSNFLALIRRFPEVPFHLVGFSSELNEGENVALEEILAQPNVLSFLDRLSLNGVISLIAHSAAVVTNDTSFAHIANAYDKPGAVIFGPTPEAFASPNGLRLFHDRSCPFFPCVQWRCLNPQQWCMKKVTSDAVAHHLGQIINEKLGAIVVPRSGGISHG